MLRDLFSLIKPTRANAPPAAAQTDNTAIVSQIFDTLDQDSVTYIGLIGALADADTTAVVLVEHGNAANLSDAAAVDDKDLLGTELGAGFQFDDDNKVIKIGYKGNKRYVRVTVTPANNTGAFPYAAVWIGGHFRSLPQTSQKHA
jgi:hypothetical protein